MWRVYLAVDLQMLLTCDFLRPMAFVFILTSI
jgi:hypothetical protein